MLHREEIWLLKEKYHGEITADFLADCTRLKEGEPLAYIIGHIPFLNCTIWLDSHPLIPRPETEYWTEKIITEIKIVQSNANVTKDATAETKLPTVRILDLCAGSGCIGVAVAHALPETIVHFAELDARHLPTITKNLIENEIPAARTHIFQSDLFANVAEQYDFILSNPPYIDPVLDRSEQSVRDFEPHHALYGGHQGLELITHIIAAAPTFLRPHGQLWLEHEPEQVAQLVKHAAKYGLTCTTHMDQFSVSRISVLTVAQ